jgi:serine protease
MRPLSCLALFAALLALALPAGASTAGPLKRASAQSAQDEIAVGLIVAFDTGPAGATARAMSVDALSAKAGIRLSKARPLMRHSAVYDFAGPVPLAQAREAAARASALPGVRYAVPNRLMRAQQMQVITDPLWFVQWNYAAPSVVPGGVDVERAWGLSRGSSDIVVAVIDTGIRGGHPDLQGRLLPGYDFVSPNTAWTDAYGLPPTWLAADGDGRDADPTDPGTYISAEDIAALPPALRPLFGSPVDSSWHGTHVAGTIAANVNGIGGVGIDRAARILPVRVLGKGGMGVESDVIAGMLWAAGIDVPGVPANPTPAHVLNLSLGGGTTCGAAYQEAIDAIVGSGRHVVAAAGNDGAPTVGAPANCRGVIAVTAHSYNGDNAWYANVGPEVVLSAPGGGCGTMAWNPLTKQCATGVRTDGVISTWNLGKTVATVDDYGALSGTSMATPHVSGTVALMLSLSPALTPAEVRSVLQSSARPHPPGTWCAADPQRPCGSGLLDAARALEHVRDNRPAVDLGPDRISPPNVELALASSVSIAPGRGAAVYRWRQIAGPALALPDTAQPVLRFTTPSTGRYGFELTVTDTAGYSGSGTVNVRVNSAPVMRPIADQTLTVGQYLVLPVRATDPDGDDVSYVVTSLPPGASFNTLTNSLIWSPSEPASGTFTVYASDGLANSAPVSATITFNAERGGGTGGGGYWPAWALPVLALVRSLRRRTSGSCAR